MEQRCDQIIHCRDESDEDSCKLIVLKDNYNNKVPPFSVNSIGVPGGGQRMVPWSR